MRDVTLKKLIERVADDATRATTRLDLIDEIRAHEGVNMRLPARPRPEPEQKQDQQPHETTCICGRVLEVDTSEFVECECGCVTAVTDGERDEVGDAALSTDTALRSLSYLANRAKDALYNVNAIIDELSRWEDVDMTDTKAVEHLRKLADGEVEDIEADACRVCKELGEPGVMWVERYSSERLCRHHGEMRAMLNQIPEVRNLNGTLHEVARIVAEHHRVYFNSHDVEEALGMDRNTLKLHRTKPRRIPDSARKGDGKPWHSIDDYQLGDQHAS